MDADLLAREVVQPGSPALEEIAQHFGGQFLHADGELNRSALGELIFGDADARAKLNAIIHPRIAQASQASLESIRTTGAAIAIYEAPLLVENGLYKTMDGLIVVSLPVGIQRLRLQQRDGIDAAAAEQRIASQLPLADKIALADYVIDNSRSVDATEKQVDAIWQLLNDQIALGV